MSTEVEAPIKFRSVSQVLEYWRCPYSTYLSRVKRVWKRPAAWLPQGTAVHAAAEAIELSGRRMTLAEAQAVYEDSFTDEVAQLCEVTPDFTRWFPSGPYGGQQDIERRYLIGLDQVEKYRDYRTIGPGSVSWPAVMPNGKPGVEYQFETVFGTVPVRGVIDYIGDDLKPVDNKTGNKPGEPFQLGVYSAVIEQETGTRPTVGTFWMAKTGKETKPVDLTPYTPEYVTDVFSEVDELIRAEDFQPDPEPSKCMFCSVRADCSYSAV
jgi:putative RecB family exonuclease